jgi:asparagine synthase (glutamine-hydrolysing)
MCGIVGVYCPNALSYHISKEYICRLRDTMEHRGPDGSGVWISDDNRIGLGHRRLSIIDLSDDASQPMCDETGRIWIVYNGEIYNHYEIRPLLEKAGHCFMTDHSDTEVIIHAYQEWGIECVRKFRGMFAFAIWDGNKRCLFLVRDRIGIKPLYYAINRGTIIFASEIKAILADSTVKREVHNEAFYHYLSFMASPAPNTLFKGIYKLANASIARIDAYGCITIKRYWDVFEQEIELDKNSEKEIAERLLDELRIAVRYRKVSDVPVGVFLSGGIDSSTNAVLFSENEKGTVKTFSIGYDEEYSSCPNEFVYARIIAEKIGASHYEKKLKMHELIDFMPMLVHYQDEPIGCPVCVPTYYLSKLARDNGVIVCQAGEGADELFWGYPEWKMLLRLVRLNDLKIPNDFRKIGLHFLALIGKGSSQSFELLRRASQNEPMFWGGAEAFRGKKKEEIISDRLRKELKDLSSYDIIRDIHKRFKEGSGKKGPLQWMSYLDLNLRLPELLLMRVDKMSMAASIETRVPFLDHKFVELAMSIPEEVKTRGGELKHILKYAVRNILPKEIINRKKQGFQVPIYEWFFRNLGEYANEKILRFMKRTEYFDPKYVMMLMEKREFMNLWYCLNFVLWHERWIE